MVLLVVVPFFVFKTFVHTPKLFFFFRVALVVVVLLFFLTFEQRTFDAIFHAFCLAA